MLTQVVATNPHGDQLTLTLGDASNGLAVNDIDGLDPVDAVLSSQEFAQEDGQEYQSGRRDIRTIIFKLGLVPDPAVTSVRALRNWLYGWFMSKAAVNLSFIDDGGQIQNTSGIVQAFAAPLFVEEPEAAITINCYDPDFYDPDPTVVSGSTTSGTDTVTVDYTGTTPVGVVLTVNVNRTLPEFTVYHNPPNGDVLTLDFVASLLSGDVLTIDTITGEKGATLVRSGALTPVLYGVNPTSTWITLQPGVNYIRVYAPGAAVPYTLQYTGKYGGL